MSSLTAPLLGKLSVGGAVLASCVGPLAWGPFIKAGPDIIPGSEPGDVNAGIVGVRWLGTGGVIDGLYSGVLLLAASGASGMLTGTAGMLPSPSDSAACCTFGGLLGIIMPAYVGVRSLGT